MLTPAWLAPDWLALPWMLAVLVLGPPAAWHAWRHAPWQPTPRAELDRIVGHLDLQRHHTFCDLGAGDGRVLLWVRAATGARCVGIEASPLQYLAARLRLAVQGDGGTAVRLADLYAADLSSFDVLYVWGTAYSVATPRFGDHVRRAVRPGARLVSYHHPVHGLEPVTVDEGGQRPIYVYVL